MSTLNLKSPSEYAGIKPLNPDLYTTLVQRFGKVKIANEGQRLITSVRPDPFTSNRTTEEDIDPGEHYRVCCPYCNDRRYRLYISYRWNTVGDDRSTYGKFRINCHNENCSMRDFEYELRLYMLDKFVLPSISNEETLPPLLGPTTLPGACIPLGDLSIDHPATRYIRKRQFDPAELHAKWAVHYCKDAPANREGHIPGTDIYARLVRNRIIVPIFWDGIMVGWQARAIDNSLPKYYTMPHLPKQRILFNGDRAMQSSFVVVVEGVFDAFRVGENAVALLGKTASYTQRELLSYRWGEGACCIMLDPDADKEVFDIFKLFKTYKFKHGLFRAVLPIGQDPGSMDRQALWSVIQKSAQSCFAAKAN